jgi:hypothetical protein
MQGIPAETTISENGPGQYEINLYHVPDALLAADFATLLKRVIKGAARKNGFDATFMAKPYGDKSGNGMHVHFSILDKDGNNIFAGEDYQGSDALRHAIGGLLSVMTESAARRPFPRSIFHIDPNQRPAGVGGPVQPLQPNGKPEFADRFHSPEQKSSPACGR